MRSESEDVPAVQAVATQEPVPQNAGPQMAGPREPGPPTRPPKRRKRFWVVIVAVIGAALLIGLGIAVATGSSGGSNDSMGFEASSDMGSETQSSGAEPGMAEPDFPTDGDTGSGFVGTDLATSSPVGVQGPESGELIKTGVMAIAVEDLQTATTEGKSTVEALGGFVAALNVSNTTSDPMATATYRVPPKQFDPAVEQLSKLGTVETQSASVDDVAPELADLDSRLQTLDTSIERLRGFLSETSDPNAIGSLEAELTRREAEAASLRAQRKALESQVDMATLDVTYSAREPVAPVESDKSGFMAGLEKGWDAAVATGSAMATALGFLLPFIPLLLLAGAAVWMVTRRRRLRVG